MFAHGSRWTDWVAFVAAVIAGLVVFVRVALPFAVSPGPLALNYVENSSRISSAGMPARSQFALIAGSGFDIVINLAPAKESGTHENEEALAAQAGMRYVGIPVSFAAPQAKDFDRFAGIMRENREKRVLVHCHMNMRASAFVFLYRVIELGEDPDLAFADVLQVWQPAPQWRAFMRERLTARGRSLPRALDRSH